MPTWGVSGCALTTISLASCCIALVACVSAHEPPGENPSYKSLQHLAQSYKGKLETAHHRKPIGKLAARILSFKVDGLQQYALCITPSGDVPENGWPVLVFNHGYVPVPSEHGIRSSTGKRDRPGDYYRGIPEEFARNGFLVIAPDYRGHADSEGAEYLESPNPLLSYSRDVVGLVRAIGRMGNVNHKRVFMLGHSMGGAITLNAAAVLGSDIQAVSIWSTQATPYISVGAPRALPILKEMVAAANVHHSLDDSTTDYEYSADITAMLLNVSNTAKLYTYQSSAHLFDKESKRQAIARDIHLFNQHFESI